MGLGIVEYDHSDVPDHRGLEEVSSFSSTPHTSQKPERAVRSIRTP